MMAACLQETYLFEEPDGHEVIKHDRAHHRNFKSSNPPPQVPHEFSRIRRLLKKSSPSRRSTVDTDPDIHAELTFKGPILFPNYPPSPNYPSSPDHDPLLPIHPSPKPRSRLLSRSSRRSLVGSRSTNEWLTPDKSPGAGKLSSMRRAVLEAASSDSQSIVVKEPSDSKVPHLSTSLPSNNTNNNNISGRQTPESNPSSHSLLTHDSYHRKPRLSISRNFIPTRVSSPKSSPLSLVARRHAASQISLCSAESETSSEIRTSASPSESPQDSGLFNQLRKSTLESKTDNLWLPAHLPPREPLSLEVRSTTRPGPPRLQDSPRDAAPDHTWFIRTRGERYHPHARGDVPYWMSYGPQVMNHHLMMQYASVVLQGSSSPFELTPHSPSATNQSSNGVRRVLDIGCGPSATWCVGVLRETSGVQVTGLDICPLQLDLGCLEKSVSSNLAFVQHNFITDPLPFDTASFDYVHASFISAGVPEDQWPHLVEEMTRVLSRHGTLEILECNTIVADPLKARASKRTDAELQQSSSSRYRIPNASASSMALNTSTSLESQLGKESSLEVAPKTVNEMVHKLLEQQFISPYPLSLLPTEVSGVTTGMRRPLAKQSIRFPSDLQSFVDTQAKSPDRAPSVGSDIPRPITIATDDPSVKAAAAECMGMLLLHSHIDAMYSNKEISWYDLWLPSISCETAASLPPTSVPRIRPSPSRMPNHIGRHFQQTRRNKSILPTRNPLKSKHNERASFKPVISIITAAASKHHDSLRSPGMPRDGSFCEKTYSRSQSNLNINSYAGSSTLDLLFDQKESIQPQPYQHEQLAYINAPRDSSTEIFTHRKNFDQIWNVWKDDLNHHSVGISKLLELRFGWTCTLDIEHHQALHEHYEYYQYELAQCESRINELRHKLQDTSGVGSSLDQDPPPPPPHTHSPSFGGNSGSPRCTQWMLHFRSETLFDENEDFEHVNLAAAGSHNASSAHLNSDTSAGGDARQRLVSLESAANGYGKNVVHRETDSQSLEELGLDTLREPCDLEDEEGDKSVMRMGRSSGSIGRLSSVALHRVRSPHRKFSRTSSMRDPAESEHDEGVSVHEPELVPLRRVPSRSKGGSSDRASIKEEHRKDEQTQQHAEIEALTRQKAEIKKAIQLIQTDLDNLTKRLALSGPDDPSLALQPSSTGPPPLAIQTIFEERDPSQIRASSEDDRAAAHTRRVDGEDSGTLGDVFTPLDRLRFSFLLGGDGRLVSPPAAAAGFFQNHPRNNILLDHDRLTTRIPTFYGGSPPPPPPPPTIASLPTMAPTCRSTRESRFTTAGFGDLKIEKFYSVKKN